MYDCSCGEREKERADNEEKNLIKSGGTRASEREREGGRGGEKRAGGKSGRGFTFRANDLLRDFDVIASPINDV